MSLAGKTVDGTLYVTSENGYQNHGKTTITLPSKVNYLPIYSRCNELLKWEDHQKDKPKHRIEEIFCSALSDSKKNSLSLPKEQVKHSLTLLKKGLKIEDTEDELTKTRHKPSSPDQHQRYLNDQNSTRTENNKYNQDDDDLPSFMTDTKVLNRENELTRELQKEKLQRLTLEKEYNSLLRQAIESRMNKEKSEQDHAKTIEEAEKQRQKTLDGKNNRISFGETHSRIRIKDSDSDQDQEENDIRDNVTVLPKYPQAQRIRWAEDSIQTHRKQYNGFPDDIYEELAHVYDKLSELDAAIHIRQEKLRRELLEKQVANQQKTIQRLRVRQNRKKTILPIPQNTNEGSNYMALNYFILFVLGLLFTKAFLC